MVSFIRVSTKAVGEHVCARAEFVEDDVPKLLLPAVGRRRILVPEVRIVFSPGGLEREAIVRWYVFGPAVLIALLEAVHSGHLSPVHSFVASGRYEGKVVGAINPQAAAARRRAIEQGEVSVVAPPPELAVVVHRDGHRALVGLGAGGWVMHANRRVWGRRRLRAGRWGRCRWRGRRRCWCLAGRLGRGRGRPTTLHCSGLPLAIGYAVVGEAAARKTAALCSGGTGRGGRDSQIVGWPSQLEVMVFADARLPWADAGSPKCWLCSIISVIISMVLASSAAR